MILAHAPPGPPPPSPSPSPFDFDPCRYVAELGATEKVTLTNLDMAKEEHKSAEYLKINPLGRVPALTDGPFSLFESGALLLYLGETFGELTTPQKRAKAAQWILFSQTTLANALFTEEVGPGRERREASTICGSREALQPAYACCSCAGQTGRAARHAYI